MTTTTNMKQYKDLLPGEVLDLKEEIVLVDPKDTPLVSMLYAKNRVVPVTDITVSWRERQLNATRSEIKKEGSEASAPLKSTRKMYSNICQIMERATSVSGTLQALSPYGIGNEYARELEDRLLELKRDMEYYFLNGVKAVESEHVGRQMNGLLNLVSASNTIDATTTGLTLDVLVDGMEKMWERGAHSDVYVFVNASEKRVINKFCQANNITVNSQVLDNKLGFKVDTIETDYGTAHIVLDRHIPKGTVLGIDLDLVEVGELRSTFHEVLAKTGDYTKGHILVENTIKLLNQYAGFKIINIDKFGA